MNDHQTTPVWWTGGSSLSNEIAAISYYLADGVFFAFHLTTEFWALLTPDRDDDPPPGGGSGVCVGFGLIITVDYIDGLLCRVPFDIGLPHVIIIDPKGELAVTAIWRHIAGNDVKLIDTLSVKKTAVIRLKNYADLVDTGFSESAGFDPLALLEASIKVQGDDPNWQKLAQDLMTGKALGWIELDLAQLGDTGWRSMWDCAFEVDLPQAVFDRRAWLRDLLSAAVQLPALDAVVIGHEHQGAVVAAAGWTKLDQARIGARSRWICASDGTAPFEVGQPQVVFDRRAWLRDLLSAAVQLPALDAVVIGHAHQGAVVAAAGWTKLDQARIGDIGVRSRWICASDGTAPFEVGQPQVIFDRLAWLRGLLRVVPSSCADTAEVCSLDAFASEIEETTVLVW